MAIALYSIHISGSSDDVARSGFAAYVRCYCRSSGASTSSDHDHPYDAEPGFRPSAPLAILWDEVFSRRLSYGERICKAYELNLRLQDLISLLPAELSARQKRHLLEDWVHGRFVQLGVSPAVAMHVSVHRRQDRQQHPVRRRRG